MQLCIPSLFLVKIISKNKNKWKAIKLRIQFSFQFMAEEKAIQLCQASLGALLVFFIRSKASPSRSDIKSEKDPSSEALLEFSESIVVATEMLNQKLHRWLAGKNH
mmetsp:Transcript_31662/g.30178  ORF Transcript_31662/g.30178 Transcript_31662/m.30178 type:complete len:106 (+) Transcript_31662:1063-1380(+)